MPGASTGFKGKLIFISHFSFMLLLLLLFMKQGLTTKPRLALNSDVVHAGLGFVVIFLPQPLVYRDYKYTPPYLVSEDRYLAIGSTSSFISRFIISETEENSKSVFLINSSRCGGESTSFIHTKPEGTLNKGVQFLGHS